MPLSKIAGTARKPSISARSASSDCKRVVLRERGDERAVSRSFGFDHDHDLPFLPCAREVGRQDHVQCRGGCVSRLDGDEPRTCRSFGNRRLDWRRHHGSRRIQIAQAHRDRVRTDFPRRARLPTAAQILDVERAFDSQAGAVILRAFAHVTAQQRRLVFSLGDAAALEQLARRLHRLPSPCIEEELLGNRDSAHGRATSPIRCVCENPRAVYPPRRATSAVSSRSAAARRRGTAGRARTSRRDLCRAGSGGCRAR